MPYNPSYEVMLIDGGGDVIETPVTQPASEQKPVPKGAAPEDVTPVAAPPVGVTPVASLSAVTREERMAQLKSEREERVVAAAESRAASNPMFDPTNRPEAPAEDADNIYYYSWIGGVTTGQWKLYKQPKTGTESAVASAQARSEGGQTKASFSSAVGANTLSAGGVTTSTAIGKPTDGSTKVDGTQDGTGSKVVNPPKPVGTPPAFVYDSVSGTWVRPSYPTDGKQYTWDDSAGWVDVNVRPGPTGTSNTETTRNLAVNTFKNTLALLFGPLEANQPWMDELYSLVSSYYKTGSTIDEAINLSLRDARNNPKLTKFTDRFKAVFALEDMVRAGRPVYVPTISEYVATEEKLADVFNRAGLGELATQQILSQVIGTGKSVTETTALITDAFALVDNAPDAWKKAIQEQFPYATRTKLATALLLGEKGAQQLEKEFQTIGVQAAAKQQGLTISQARAQDIFAQGYGYTQALAKFGEVSSILGRGQQLAEFSKQAPLTQLDVEQARIEKLSAKQKKIEELAAQEEARFSGQYGGLKSQRRAIGGMI
jgi:hypothetical protein